MSEIKANRKSVRAPVVPTQIRGLLTRRKGGEQLPFLIWDVSETGLGLWCTDKIEVGEKIRLTVGQPFPLLLDCEVMWVDDVKEGEGYRCGLEVTEGTKKLAGLYDKFREIMEQKASAATGS